MKKLIFVFFSLLIACTVFSQRTSFSAKKIFFQAHLDASAIFTAKYYYSNYENFDFTLAGPSLDITLGVRATKYFYLGMGTGYHTLMSKFIIGNYNGSAYNGYVFDYNHYVPLYANLKTYWPISVKVAPFLDCSLGGYFGLYEMVGYAEVPMCRTNKLANGFYLRTGLGIDIMRANVGVGYELLKNRVGSEHIGYVKLGWRFG